MAYPPFLPQSGGPLPVELTSAEFRAAFPAESEYVEFKRGVGGRPLQESVVGFSNSSGGVILIGVSDDGEPVGRELTPGLADDIHRVLREVNDPGTYDLGEISVDGRPVTTISVARRVRGFAQTSDGRVLVARGTRKDALLGAELQRFINERALTGFEETDAGADLEQASDRLLEGLASAFGWSEPRSVERLEERGLVIRGGRRLTVAGALCLLDQPHRELGRTSVEVFRYRDGGEEYDRRVEIVGPAGEQIERTSELVMAEIGEDTVVLGVRRHELPRLPRRVVREAVANAVAHRSYEQTGTPVRVEIRPEAVLVVSPGGLPEPVTERNIRETQAARNVNLIAILRKLGLAENAGDGVDVMEDLMRDEMLDPPRFRDEGHRVVVTLPVRSTAAPSERAWLRELEQRGSIEPADRVLLVHAARGELLTNRRARELLSTDSVTARQALQRLRDADFLEQRGSRAATAYSLKESLAPPAGLRLSRAQLRDLVLEMADDGPIANADVRARTGLDRIEALGILSDLVRERRLSRVGERRGSRYVRP